MTLRERIMLWRLKRRLRKLQDAYYGGEETVIAEYFRTLESARNLVRAKPRMRSLHLGSGDHHISGWFNIDRDVTMPVDAVVDLTLSLPFRSESIDLIHSEDFIEHLDEAPAKLVLRECHRVLRPGGVMRLLTPDLRSLVDEIYIRRNPHHLRWCSIYLEANDPCAALNMHMRMSGDHRFIYDEEHLTALLREIGFAVRRVRYNWSTVPQLRFLDLRDFGLNLFLESVKR